MNYASIKPFDVANGPGVRVSLFVSGCTHHCKGCFNPEAWDFQHGAPFTDAQVQEILTHLEPDYIKGLSLLGGEPFEPQNQSAVLALCQTVRERFPRKTIWCYSGYRLELDILSGRLGNTAKALLAQLDVLVDGPFIEEKKDLHLRFRGSSNQRILDVPASLSAGHAVLWDGALTI